MVGTQCCFSIIWLWCANEKVRCRFKWHSMCSNRQTGWALSWNCRLVPAWKTWKAQLWQQACILEISDYSPNTTTMIMIRFVILVKSAMELQTLGKLGILGMLAWFNLCNIELLLNCSVCPRHKIQIYTGCLKKNWVLWKLAVANTLLLLLHLFQFFWHWYTTQSQML